MRSLSPLVAALLLLPACELLVTVGDLTLPDTGATAADAGTPPDASVALDAAAAAIDATVPGDDAGSEPADAQTPPADAATEPGVDAAEPGLDAAEPGLDAAQEGADAAPPGLDAAAAGLDATTVGRDAGAPFDAGPNTCVIGGQSYTNGTPDPTQPCRKCDVATSNVAWTPLANGLPCASGKVCYSGACLAGCWIGGYWTAGTRNTTNRCQSCQPSSSTTQWTMGADGFDCGNSTVCVSQTCQLGCWIDSAFRGEGQVNGSNTCERCDPYSTVSGWSQSPTGTSCGPRGSCCQDGSCAQSDNEWAGWSPPPDGRTTFRDDGNFVTDTLTGLSWEKNLDPTERTRMAASAYCATLNLGGTRSSGWRLPTVIELQSILDLGLSGPALSASFPGTPSLPFWSSSGVYGSSTQGWTVHFGEGSTTRNDLSLPFRVRCVWP